MSFEFHNTVHGQRFFNHDLPNLIENIKDLSIEISRLNQLKADELELREKELRIREKELNL